MSAGIGEHPMGSKTFTALTFASSEVELLVSDVVVRGKEHVDCEGLDIDDARGQQECVDVRQLSCC